MSIVGRFAKNLYTTFAPELQESPACGATQFRWGVHVALPFTLPSRTCIHQHVTLDGRRFDYSIHNQLDRLTAFPASRRSWPSVHLIRRRDPTPRPKPGWNHAREILQSVACFVELSDFSNPNDAFACASDKVKTCFRHLTDHLGQLQLAMPYLASWQIYPVSQFDVGLVYHSVEHFCPTKNCWDHYHSGITLNVARLLHQPISLIDFGASQEAEQAVQLSNELLAEAQASLLRGLYRSTVLNSYQAVETLANSVFRTKHLEMLLNAGESKVVAEAEAEKLRNQNRLRIKFLMHDGLHRACGQSFCHHDKQRYDRLLQLKELRNRVAHAGQKPQQAESEASHLLCCEVVQWLCGVAGYPVRPLFPDPEDQSPEFVSLPADINAVPIAARQFLHWVLGVPTTREQLQMPCQFGLRVGVTASAYRSDTDEEKQSN